MEVISDVTTIIITITLQHILPPCIYDLADYSSSFSGAPEFKPSRGNSKVKITLLWGGENITRNRFDGTRVPEINR